jgi:hypothetical protein
MEDNRKFIKCTVMWRWDGEAGKHIVVGVPKTKSAHLFNPTGAKIFFLCDGKHTIENIIQILNDEYPQATERIKDDVLRFLDYLTALDVIRSDISAKV